MPPRRRKPTARRSSGARGIRRPAGDLPTAGPGQRIWLLDIPYGTTATGTRWIPQWKAFVHVAATLPDHLQEYTSTPFSYQRWLEDDLNSYPGAPAHGIAPKQPRRQQYEGADAIIAAAESGARQFLLADAPGTGKTITLIMAATEVALSRAQTRGGPGTQPKILVAVDRPVGITVPHWRTSIAAVDTGDPRAPRWLVISPDQLPKLLAGNGKPRFAFDVIILDEAQLYRHLDTKRVTAMRRIARYTDAHDTAPFVIAATATPAHNPAELTYLGPLFAQVHGRPPADWADVGRQMQAAGLPLEMQYGKWNWSPSTTPVQQQAAAQLVRRWLTDHDPALMLHRAAEWGEAPLEPMPVELDAAEHRQYQTEWGIFQREMDLARVGRSTAKGRAAIMRFRQKAGMIRVPYTVDWAANQVKAGRQVVISVEFVSTAADPIAEALADKGIDVARIYGSGRYDVEAERLRFQRGQAPVCVFTVTSSISLHAGEMLADGTTATDTPRVGVLHQPGYSGIATRQRLGRIHRDGQVGEWWLAFAEGTVEEEITGTLLDRLRATSDLVGGDTAALHSIASLLGAQWLPDQVLGETGENS